MRVRGIGPQAALFAQMNSRRCILPDKVSPAIMPLTERPQMKLPVTGGAGFARSQCARRVVARSGR